MKKKPLEQLTPEQVTLRRMAVTAEVNNAYNTTEMRNGTYGYLITQVPTCLLYTSPSPRDRTRSRMPSSA